VAERYYLAAQLPSLPSPAQAETAPLPIESAAFQELCARFLDGAAFARLAGAALVPPREAAPSGSAVLDAWNAMERGLRRALAAARARRLGRDAEAGDADIPPEAAAAAKAALALDNPLEAERFLNAFRYDFITRITPFDMFCDEALYAYAVRLKLAERARKFSGEAGEASYHILYNQILGDAQ